MAKNKRHIDLELKEKLTTHEVPVMEGDWAAFESFRTKKESKRKRFIYLIAAALVFIGVSGIVVWKFQEAKNRTIQEVVHAPQTTEEASVTPDNSESRPGQGDHQAQENTNTQESDTRSNNQAREKSNSPSFPDPVQKPSSQTQQPEANYHAQPQVISQPQPYALALPSIGIKIPQLVLNWAEIPRVQAFETTKDKDTSKGPAGKKPSRIPPVSTPSLAFGLAYGFGNPNLTVGAIDTSQTHRQYEKTLKEAKQNSQVFRLFLQYEYRMKLGLEFGAGLQFSSLTQVQKYNFELRDIPYLYPNGNIWFYINIPPNQAVTPTVFESSQQIFSASVPLSIGYARQFGPGLRAGLRAQGSFGMNWSKDFNGLSPKTLSETGVRANVNPFNMSYGGGLFGEYFYLDKWSTRLSLDWTAQNRLYKNSNSFNITNRYYEFKLALVRYL